MDILVNPVVSRLVDTLINLTIEELHLILGVPEEILRLRETLCSIQGVLNDAEQRQITQQTVKRWLSRLTDVMYDADDILDEYRIVAEERASQEHPPEEPFVGRRMLQLCGCFGRVKFTHEIGSKIRDLNQRLERISADRSKFDLRVDISISDRQKVVARVRRETSPGVEPDIVGEAIEKNTRDMVDLLKKEEENAYCNVIVHAIVGFGGIGKTTLAQKIFNDDEIKAVFQKTMWVCVSQEFVETDLLREIIRSAKESPGEARSKADLEDMVMHLLKDKKFFLVLDDVWDAQIWKDWLRKPLQVGAVGSRVLVTTRDQRVATQMGATHRHNVDELSLDDSWLLMCKSVAKNIEEERDVESLKDIGMEIVKKCKGLPLAIIAIGGVLRGEFERRKWQEVERSSAWSRTGLPDGIHQALYLSYEDLPSHLKQCFLYCSLFREDSYLYREDLIKLWVAEGFVVKVEREEYPSLEEIAQGYYEELVQRSLLQVYEDVILGSYCTMHDLLRSLCHFLARGESSVIRDISEGQPRTADDDSIKLRRLSVVAPESQFKTLLPLIQSHKSVRTLLLERQPSLDDRDIEDCFNNFQRLRVVHLGNYLLDITMIESLPQSIGNLLHLRYLNLSYCERIMSLPESIGSLKYLQFLILQGCFKLQNLPKEVVKLCNLRTLDLDGVPLKELPSGIARLEHLNVLKGAVFSSISNDSSSSSCSCSLEEISQLRKLRELSIFNLAMISAVSDPNVNGLNSTLTTFKDLMALDLICSIRSLPFEQIRHYKEQPDKLEKIFDVALHPPSCVHQIKIDEFIGHQFPRWLMSNNINLLFPNLTKLVLANCDPSLLPPLGKLPNLELLDLIFLCKVTSIGVEFFGYEEASTSVGHEIRGSKIASSLVLFPRLKRLYLRDMFYLKAWHWVPEDGGIVAMPRLNELIVDSCSMLLSLPEGLNRQATCLTKLYIRGTNIDSISGFPSVKDLFINNESDLNILSHLPALEVLKVHLNIEEESLLPDWLVQGLTDFTSLHRLYLHCKNKHLLYRCLQDGPDWPKISHIPIVEIKSSLNYITYIKHSSTFKTNII